MCGIGVPMKDFYEVANTPEQLAAMLATLNGIRNELLYRELVAFAFDTVPNAKAGSFAWTERITMPKHMLRREGRHRH